MRTMRWMRSYKSLAVAGLGVVAVVFALPAPDPSGEGARPEAQLLAVTEVPATPAAPAPVQAVAEVSAPAQAPAEAAVLRAATPAAAVTAEAEPALADMPRPAAVEVELPNLPAAEELTRERGFIGTAAVNVRSGPSTNAASLLVAQPGTPVSIGARENGWVEVSLPGGTSGWVFSRYVGSEAPSAAPARQQAEAVAPRSTRKPAATPARSGGDLVVQAAPRRGAPTLFVLSAGDRIQVSEQRGNWLRVVTESGVSGWVRAN